MPIPVIMPKLEMSQETALVLEWMKKEGEQVNQGEALLHVETDKVTIEVESPANGVLAGILVKQNDVVPVTTTIAYLLQKGETKEDIPPQKILTGDVQLKNQEISQYSKSLSATPIAARMAEAEGIDINQITGTGRNGEITRADVENEIRNKLVTLPGKVRATPAARKTSHELGIRLSDVKGSGPRGRIQVNDVLTPSKIIHDSAETPQSFRLEGMRRTIAERLQSSYQTVPHIYLTASANVFAVEALRSQLNFDANERGDTHVTLTAIMVYFVSKVLKKYPILNSTLKSDEILILPDINIGVAVALNDGLIVPVIRNAVGKSLSEIATELTSLMTKARESRLLPSDVSGGTFTISNLGQYGVEEFTAIINPGQTGILAVGAMIQQPVAEGCQVVIRPVMKMTLAVDHRVVDGVISAKWLADLKKFLENPAMIHL